LIQRRQAREDRLIKAKLALADALIRDPLKWDPTGIYEEKVYAVWDAEAAMEEDK
jgi:hypothetical protein